MVSESSPAPAQPSAKFDLTHTLSPYLDLHLMFPTLQFLMENNMYNSADLQRAQLKLLHPTNMVDYAMELHKQVHGTAEVPAADTYQSDPK